MPFFILFFYCLCCYLVDGMFGNCECIRDYDDLISAVCAKGLAKKGVRKAQVRVRGRRERREKGGSGEEGEKREDDKGQE